MWQWGKHTNCTYTQRVHFPRKFHLGLTNETYGRLVVPNILSLLLCADTTWMGTPQCSKPCPGVHRVLRGYGKCDSWTRTVLRNSAKPKSAIPLPASACVYVYPSPTSAHLKKLTLSTNINKFFIDIASNRYVFHPNFNIWIMRNFIWSVETIIHCLSLKSKY